MSATPAPLNTKPPRPPNSWILYRSDMHKDLKKNPPPGPRLTQAQVSKRISDQWKNETPEVRDKYERRAEEKKIEHMRLYPNYRFQPVKKEEREREREEQREEKRRVRAETKRRGARPAPYHVPIVAPQPLPQFFSPSFGVSHCPEGPSPPVSAAASPSPDYPSPVSCGSGEEVGSQSSNPIDLTGFHVEFSNDAYIPVLTPQSTPSNTAPLPPSDDFQDFPESSHFGTQQQYIDQNISRQPYSTHQQYYGHAQSPHQEILEHHQQYPSTTPHQQQYLESTQQQQFASIPDVSDNLDPHLPLAGSSGEAIVSFNMPNQSMLNLDWLDSDGLNFDALLGPTGDPSIFEIPNFNPDSLVNHPSGEVEIMVHQSASNHFAQEPFGSFDMPGFDSSIPAYENANAGPSMADHMHSDQSTLGGDDMVGSLSASSSMNSLSFENYMDQFVSFSDSTPSTSFASPPAPALQSSQSVYTPPAGASHSSTRRVAGSWRPSFVEADTTLDPIPRAWVVPAS